MTAASPAPLHAIATQNQTAQSGGPVAVLLHGRGSNRRDLISLAPAFPADWTIVTPEALHPGMPWGYGPGSAWYRYLQDNQVVGETMEQSLSELDKLMTALPEMLGAAPSRVVLGGFSQGGTMSLAYAITRAGRPDYRVDRVLNFSGFLVDDPAVELTESAVQATPIFWGHGHQDPAIPFSLAERGRATLREFGADLTISDHDIGHWIDAAELDAAVRWIG